MSVAPCRPYTFWDWIAWFVGALALVTAASIVVPRAVHGQDLPPDQQPDPVLDASPTGVPAQRSPTDEIFDQLWALVAAAVAAGVAAGLGYAKIWVRKKIRELTGQLDTVVTGVAISGSPEAKAAVKDLAQERGLEVDLNKSVRSIEAKNSTVIKKKTTMAFDPSKIERPDEEAKP